MVLRYHGLLRRDHYRCPEVLAESNVGPCNAALGVDLIPEDVTSHGRIDLTVRHRGRVWLVEFKVNELSQPGRALAQLKARDYVAKYAASPVTLIGIEFSRETRNISRFEWEDVAKRHPDLALC